MDLFADLLKRWKKEGYRMTPTRQALLQLFLNEKQPLSVEMLQKKIKAKRGKAAPDPSTLYRELDFLEKEAVIKEVLLPDSPRLLELNLREHHHHLYCLNCNIIEEVEMENELADLQRSLEKKRKFQITSHALEFFGLCQNCKTS